MVTADSQLFDVRYYFLTEASDLDLKVKIAINHRHFTFDTVGGGVTALGV